MLYIEDMNLTAWSKDSPHLGNRLSPPGRTLNIVDGGHRTDDVKAPIGIRKLPGVPGVDLDMICYSRYGRICANCTGTIAAEVRRLPNVHTVNLSIRDASRSLDGKKTTSTTYIEDFLITTPTALIE
jgi:hypothetical protein